jgi:hypothetical protein
MFARQSREPEGGQQAEGGAAGGALTNGDGKAIEASRVHTGLLGRA